MPKFISIFNNKGGVGKTIITWNLADTIARKNKKVLLIDFDPQCNLSLAVLGGKKFKDIVSATNICTIRAFLQGYLQNTGPGNVEIFTGQNTHDNVKIVPGDFWLNVYSDSLSVGHDLLTGNGISKFVAIRTLVSKLVDKGEKFDYVMIDLPPSFGGLVRSAIYSSDYIIIPCTSDTFSEYCVGLIAQMLPQFVSDWSIGIQRFKQNNYALTDFDGFGRPIFGGWIFNGFDTRSGRLLLADQAHEKSIQESIRKLAQSLNNNIKSYNPLMGKLAPDYNLGHIEDMNVIMQNSLWQNVPAAQLGRFLQVKDLTGGKAKWSAAQVKLIGNINAQISAIADNLIANF